VSYQTVLDICNKKVKKPKFNLKFQEEKWKYYQTNNIMI
jgi:hypothetical protein